VAALSPALRFVRSFASPPSVTPRSRSGAQSGQENSTCLSLKGDAAVLRDPHTLSTRTDGSKVPLQSLGPGGFCRAIEIEPTGCLRGQPHTNMVNRSGVGEFRCACVLIEFDTSKVLNVRCHSRSKRHERHEVRILTSTTGPEPSGVSPVPLRFTLDGVDATR